MSTRRVPAASLGPAHANLATNAPLLRRMWAAVASAVPESDSDCDSLAEVTAGALPVPAVAAPGAGVAVPVPIPVPAGTEPKEYMPVTYFPKHYLVWALYGSASDHADDKVTGQKTMGQPSLRDANLTREEQRSGDVVRHQTKKSKKAKTQTTADRILENHDKMLEAVRIANLNTYIQSLRTELRDMIDDGDPEEDIVEQRRKIKRAREDLTTAMMPPPVTSASSSSSSMAGRAQTGASNNSSENDISAIQPQADDSDLLFDN
jgi:hypothetical protein